MNLAYIIGTYPLLTTTFIEREVETLRELGLSIQLLSIRRPPADMLLDDRHIAMQRSIIYLLPVDWRRLVLAHLRFALLRPIAYFALLDFLLSRPHRTFRLRVKTLLHFAEGVYAAYRLRGQKWDHLHAHFVDRAATVALCVSRLLNTPYSLTAHANDIYTDQALIREKIAGSRFTVTVSEFNKAYLLQHYPSLNANKIFVLHPWVDLGCFQPPEIRPAHARLRIVSVGRLVEKKGHRYLIEACHLLQQQGVDFECRILGDGPLQADLQALLARYGVVERVQLMGGQPQAEVLSRLSQADVFVLACTVARNGDRDGMPVALAEAMAMELPAVSTALAGIGELVRPGAGYLVPSDDAVALADAIKSVADASSAERVQMGKVARAIVAEEFDLRTGIRRLARLFRNADG